MMDSSVTTTFVLGKENDNTLKNLLAAKHSARYLAKSFVKILGSFTLSLMLTAISSSQEIQRTGAGNANVQCEFCNSNACGSCLGSGSSQSACPGPACDVSITDDAAPWIALDGAGTITGQSRLSMSAIKIQGSGSASWTPPAKQCSMIDLGPTYFASGSQSVYAAVTNGAPIQVTLTSNISASGGGKASWSSTRNSGGNSSTTITYDVSAGPQNITAGGQNFYLVDSIQASGQAGAIVACGSMLPNSQSFDFSLSMTFCVNAGIMTAASPSSFNVSAKTPIALQVQVSNGCSGSPFSGQTILFSTSVVPIGGEDFSLPSSGVTNSNGIASASFVSGSSTGTYVVNAFCPSCSANQKISFTITVSAPQQEPALSSVFCDGSYPVGQTDPLTVEVLDTLTGAALPGISVNFQIAQNPGGGFLSASSALTDVNGEAQSLLTLGPNSGAYEIQVNCPQCSSNQTLTCPVTAITTPNGSQSDPPSQPMETNASPNLSIATNVSQIIPSDASGNPLITGQANTANISIIAPSTVTWAAAVIPVDDSGGHNHDGLRPAGNLLGSLSQTSGSGRANLTFTSGQIGEQEEIKVTDSSGDESDAFINVQASNLQELSVNNNLYLETGQTGNHPSNHYGLPSLLGNAELLASAYLSSYGATLQINDMSLSMGGLFDVSGNWKTPHLCHRLGSSIDVDHYQGILGIPGRSILVPNMGLRLQQLIVAYNKQNTANPIDCERVVEALTSSGLCNVHFECPSSYFSTCPQLTSSCVEP